MNNYGQRIKIIREAAKLSQTQLGKQVGTTGVTIMRYEKGQREPRIDQLQKIANALDISIAFFQAAPPFENLDFLERFKSVIIFALDEKHFFNINERPISTINNYEYWKAISENITSIVQTKDSSLSIQYKHTDAPIEDIKFSINQATFDFSKPLEALFENGHALAAHHVLRGLTLLNANGIDKVLERIDELVEINKYKINN